MRDPEEVFKEMEVSVMRQGPALQNSIHFYRKMQRPSYTSPLLTDGGISILSGIAGFPIWQRYARMCQR